MPEKENNIIYHKFKVVKAIEKMTFEDVSSVDAMRLDDYLIQYMGDSLQWIDAHWNKLDAENTGLNYYGVTFLTRHESILQMKKIITTWRDLFVLAPDKIVLTVEYDVEKMRFDRIALEKSTVVDSLNELIGLCEQAIAEKKLLVHFGI